MVTAIRQSVTVLPGGVVEVRSGDLPAGATADVIVLIDRPGPAAPPPRRPLASFIGTGKGLFRSVAEIDAYVRGLRDEWDR